MAGPYYYATLNFSPDNRLSYIIMRIKVAFVKKTLCCFGALVNSVDNRVKRRFYGDSVITLRDLGSSPTFVALLRH